MHPRWKKSSDQKRPSLQPSDPCRIGIFKQDLYHNAYPHSKALCHALYSINIKHPCLHGRVTMQTEQNFKENIHYQGPGGNYWFSKNTHFWVIVLLHAQIKTPKLTEVSVFNFRKNHGTSINIVDHNPNHVFLNQKVQNSRQG